MPGFFSLIGFMHSVRLFVSIHKGHPVRNVRQPLHFDDRHAIFASMSLFMVAVCSDFY